MNKIFRYNIPLAQTVNITTHINAKPISVQEKNEDISLWMVVDTSLPKETRRFFLVGTGDEFDASDKKFIGTVQLGSLVFHLFEVIS